MSRMSRVCCAPPHVLRVLPGSSGSRCGGQGARRARADRILWSRDTAHSRAACRDSPWAHPSPSPLLLCTRDFFKTKHFCVSVGSDLSVAPSSAAAGFCAVSRARRCCHRSPRTGSPCPAGAQLLPSGKLPGMGSPSAALHWHAQPSRNKGARQGCAEPLQALEWGLPYFTDSIPQDGGNGY